jgi:hypothetical protein
MLNLLTPCYQQGDMLNLLTPCYQQSGTIWKTEAEANRCLRNIGFCNVYGVITQKPALSHNHCPQNLSLEKKQNYICARLSGLTLQRGG